MIIDILLTLTASLPRGIQRREVISDAQTASGREEWLSGGPTVRACDIGTPGFVKQNSYNVDIFTARSLA